jgi:FKBP-type peptidyl-prolyl cis-trans isomerase FklB
MQRTSVLSLSVLALSTTIAICEAAEPAKKEAAGKPAAVALQTTQDQASYAVGLNIARSLKSDGFAVNVDALIQGLRDAFAGTPPRLTDEQCQAALKVVQQELMAKQEDQRKVAGSQNRQEGQAFLAANGKKEGVTTLPSGLQYKVIKSGTGPTPKLTDTVRTHYHGTLIDGTVFDSSVKRGEPISFPVGGVIRGWTEALQLMKVGDKWQLFIPSELAYGPQGAGGVIGPDSVLIFEIELLGIGE